MIPVTTQSISQHIINCINSYIFWHTVTVTIHLLLSYFTNLWQSLRSPQRRRSGRRITTMMLVSAMWRSLNRQEEYMQDPSKHPKMRNSIRAQSDKMKKESMALEKRMDPLLARREWNNKHALLSRLPDELILTIIEDYVRDPSDLFVMSRVCRKFRYLILFKTGILRGRYAIQTGEENQKKRGGGKWR